MIYLFIIEIVEENDFVFVEFFVFIRLIRGIVNDL